MNGDRLYLGPMALAAGGLFLSMAGAGEAAPAPTSQQLTINAAVPATCTLTLAAPSSGAAFSGGVATLTLSNTTGAISSGLVSSVENCNDKSGYVMTVTDTNDGTLKGSTGNTDTITYSIVYDPTGTDKTVTPSTTSQTLFTSGGKVNATKQVTASFTVPGGFVTADTYTDTLTFTMTPQ